jgi:hypothetical protein
MTVKLYEISWDQIEFKVACGLKLKAMDIFNDHQSTQTNQRNEQKKDGRPNTYDPAPSRTGMSLQQS